VGGPLKKEVGRKIVWKNKDFYPEGVPARQENTNTKMKVSKGQASRGLF